MWIDRADQGPRPEEWPEGSGARRPRWLAAVGGAARRRIALAALSVAIAAIYLLATAESGAPVTYWLDDGRVFSSDEAHSVGRALAGKGIGVVRGVRGQLGVASEQKATALKALESAGLDWQSLKEMIDRPVQASVWADPLDRQRIRLRARERAVEALISRFHGVLAATVRLHESGTGPYDREGSLDATVILTPADPGAITPDLIERVQIGLVSLEPRLDRDRDVTVIDDQGQAYLLAGDPKVAQRRHADARAYEWESTLSRRLSALVPEVRVSVRLEWPLTAGRSSAERSGSEVVPNAPAALAEPGVAAEPSQKANVLVEVPTRSFLNLYRAGDRADHFPTPEELGLIEQVARKRIEAEVRHVIPGASLGPIEVVRIPLPVTRGTSAEAPRPSRPDLRPWFAAAALVGVLLTLAATAGTRRFSSSRRAAREPSAEPSVRFDGEDRAGPVDRVRELIRRDPDAAAGVLRRWVGQGGPPR